jgi:hypothetical protein
VTLRTVSLRPVRRSLDSSVARHGVKTASEGGASLLHGDRVAVSGHPEVEPHTVQPAYRPKRRFEDLVRVLSDYE